MTTPPYKNMFHEGEVLLVYFQKQPAFFLRVEEIRPDHKKNWWRMQFITLTIPINTITWILDDDQMRGDGFTMSGHSVHIERIASNPEQKDKKSKDESNPSSDANIVSLFG